MNRFKDLLLSISIIFSLIILFLIIISILNIKTTTKISLNTKTEQEYLSLKDELDIIENSDCKNELLEYTKYVDMGNFDGEVKIKKLYNYFKAFNSLSLYNNINEKCDLNLENNDEKGIANKYVSNIILADSILNKYLFNYELRFHDSLKDEVSFSTDSALYLAYRNNQIQVLRDYLDILGNKEVSYE